MACAALKRPYNFDLLNSTSQQHQAVASPKRRRCGSTAVSSLPSSSPSPFLEVTPKIDRVELAQSVHDEWQRMQRRKKLASEASSPPTYSDSLANSSRHVPSMFPGTSYWTTSMQVGGGSPSPSDSMSPSRPDMSPTYSGSLSPVSRSSKDQPTMSVKQVVVLCERLWKEREEKLREEYDNVLNERLAEQYDSFLKFTQDQIMRKYQQSTCSYVS